MTIRKLLPGEIKSFREQVAEVLLVQPSLTHKEACMLVIAARYIRRNYGGERTLEILFSELAREYYVFKSEGVFKPETPTS